MVHAFVLFCLSLFGVIAAFGVETDEMKSVSVMEGDSVTLLTDAEIKKDDLILWRFGAEDSPMAEVNRSAQIISVSESTKGFKDRLQLDPQTGSLTVRNIRTDHSGIYKAQIIGNKMIRKTFNVTVYARLPVPIISRDCCSSSSSSSYCSLVCFSGECGSCDSLLVQRKQFYCPASVFLISAAASLYIWRWNIRIKTATAVSSTITSATRLNIWTLVNSVRYTQVTLVFI
ncbi:uncharacterized protein LOC122141746 [Cyprinus carpio]|uniref:Uncharacterized protein LOC122141746 n=1 Tax=Cyprinus carpio TaxID=7962 RepID=A0A9Q9XPW6_CYPCA|nr:uncharacterized protein LOC122141746 [Cyprinus carpio]